MKSIEQLCLLCWMLGIGMDFTTNEAIVMTEAAVSEGTSEESSTTESWSFGDYTTRDYAEYYGTTNEATATTESKLSGVTSEESSTTESWNFEDYTSRSFAETLLKNTSPVTQDKIQAFRKVAQILTLLGEKIIPTILGESPVNKCAKKMQTPNEKKSHNSS